MKSLNIIKKAALSLATVAAAFTLGSASVSAIPYSGDSTPPAPSPAFNVYTGVPSEGNEADFFRARVPAGDPSTATNAYSDPLNTDCTDGKLIQMRVYVHNGASQHQNNNGTGPSVAHGTKVRVALPGNEASSFNSTATISANNAATVTDGVSINCNGQTVKLKYVAGSATQYSKAIGVTQVDDSIVTTGASIRSHQVPGDVWGCWDERVFVVLTVKVEKKVTPPPVMAQCTLLTVTASDNRTVRVSNFKWTNENASVKNVVLNWGDGSQVVLTNPNQVTGQTHQYKNNGSFIITAVITFAVEGKADIVSGGAGTACAQQVTFEKGKPPVVTPPKPGNLTPPSVLPNAGAGSAAAMFAAVTAAGSFAYRRFVGRSLS